MKLRAIGVGQTRVCARDRIAAAHGAWIPKPDLVVEMVGTRSHPAGALNVKRHVVCDNTRRPTFI